MCLTFTSWKSGNDPVLHVCCVSLHSFQQEKLLSYTEEVIKTNFFQCVTAAQQIFPCRYWITLCCSLVKSAHTALWLDAVPGLLRC